MVNILINILIQIAIFIVLVYAVGYIISLINKFFYKSVNGNRIVCYATGFIGTPIHELSHALLCVVFFHKVEEIKLFQIDDENGVLGYVNHSYNKKNIYQVIGNYFIGVAPIICGAVVLYFLMMLLLPSAYLQVQESFSELSLVIGGQQYSYLLSGVFNLMCSVFKGVFLSSLADWKWWVFLVVCLCIALHMNLSGADIKGSLTALPMIVLLISILNLAFGFTPVYSGFLNVVTYAGCTLIGFLMLSVIFSMFILIIGLIVWAVRKLIIRR